jgi:hypothetical protein
MKACISALLVKPALRTSTFAALFLGVVVMAPAYGQELERDRMVALDKQLTSGTPPALEHSQRSIFAAGTELLTDGGFEGGYYGGSKYGSQGVTGSWGWWNGTLNLDGSITYAASGNPIWQNYGGVNARTGQFMAYFNPLGPSASRLYQTILIPSGNTATLSFWLKIGATASSSPSDKLFVCFEDYTTKAALGCPVFYSATDAVGYSWVYYSYDVSRVAGKSVSLLFQSEVTASTIFQVDDISVTSSATNPPPSATCTEDAFTMCLVNGRYKVTSRWLNQYAGAGGWPEALSKAKLTDTTGAFWIADASTYEYMIRFNTATNNGRVWVAIPTFTDVEFWVAVTDTVNGQSKEYHSAPGNKTLIYDPSFFVYP